MLKDKLIKLFRCIGVKIVKSRTTKYEYLLLKKRYFKQQIYLKNIPFEIADSHSFYFSHREIFLNEIYKFKTGKSNPVIIDCGSNYGVSILYFKQLYPDSKIIGIEADPDIFNILKSNIERRNFNNITLLNKAISNVQGSIQFFSEGADGGRIHNMAKPKKSFIVDTISLDDLINCDVDFLKIDIEGAETDVICTSLKIRKVNQIFIEYHSFQDDIQKLGMLLSFLSKNDFRYYIHTQFCSNKPFVEYKTQLGMDLQLNIFAIRN